MDLLFDVIAVQINTPHLVHDVLLRGAIPTEAESYVRVCSRDYGPKDQFLTKVSTGKYRRGDTYKGA